MVQVEEKDGRLCVTNHSPDTTATLVIMQGSVLGKQTKIGHLRPGQQKVWDGNVRLINCTPVLKKEN